MPFNDVLLFNNFSATLLLCSTTNHISFEGAYFSFLQSGGQYYLSGSGANMTLIISNPIFINYVFRNYPLHSPDFDLERISIYPNPAKTTIFLNPTQVIISKIQIINSLGQTVKTINDGFEEVPIADLPAGIYILKIDTELGVVSRKIIKE